MKKDMIYRVGIIGAGFIARGLMMAIERHPTLKVNAVLTRRDPATLGDLPVPLSRVTHDVHRLAAMSDIVVECTGDVIHGTAMIEEVFKAGKPVVTMNSELQLVSGTMLARQGTLVEAEGDQPGSLAALNAEVRAMGFEPLVYGNIKRFLNLNPTPDEMEYWAKRQGISLTQVTSFTDGTKVQIEQALVANGLGATIACRNLSGISCTALEDGAQRLAEIAEGMGKPISDYILSPTAPAGVFIVATHAEKQQPYLEYLKMGSGPYYVITKPYHLCHLEIPKTIFTVLAGNGTYTFNNGQQPTVQVYAIPKHDIKAGEIISRGLGSFSIRGEAAKIENHPHGVPIGLLHEATFVRPVSAGKIVTFDDVALPPSRALTLWLETAGEVTSPTQQVKKAARHQQPIAALPTVTVGVPAYNEEANIIQMLRSLMRQRQRGYALEQVIVLCDGCTDGTEGLVRDFARQHPTIEIVGGSERLGKAARLNQLLEMNESDILIHFDADVVLADQAVIEHMVRKFDEDGVALVAASWRPVAAQGFIAKAIRAGEELWYQVRRDYRDGHNIHNISGCATALTRDFADSFRYPYGIVADQNYVYLQARVRGKKFRFAPEAIVWYQAPSTFADSFMQSRRTLHEKDQVLSFFSLEMKREYHVPMRYKLRGIGRGLAAAPLAISLGFVLQILYRLHPDALRALPPTGLWKMAASTKKVIL